MTDIDHAAKLASLVEEIPTLRTAGRRSSEFTKWRERAEVAVVRAFGENSRTHNKLKKIKYTLSFFADSTPESTFHNAFLRGLDKASALLEASIHELTEYGSPSDLADRMPPGGIPGTVEVGKKWKSVLENHPLRVALGLLVAGFLAGLASGLFLRPAYDRFVAPAKTFADEDRCRVHEFRVHSSLWNTGNNVLYHCEGTTFGVGVRTDDKRKGAFRFLLTADTRDGNREVCEFACQRGEENVIMSSCSLFALPPRVNCADDNMALLVWLPRSL